MNSAQFSSTDMTRSRLRTTVATIAGELARLIEPAAAEGSTPLARLHAAFADLVEQLALGPEPEVRECPACKHIIMRAATQCGYCWTKVPIPG